MATRSRKKTPKPENEIPYKTIPALANYIDRIGAEQLNFKRFMVKEYKGNYYVEKCLIRIVDGEIKCSHPAYAPTPDEEKEINAQLAVMKFPKPIKARNINELKPYLTGTAYEFIDRKTNEIIMVQERVTFKDGTKAYLPWTFFDDGQWRRMEPEGDLPFWKPIKKTKAKIMIHEGAKSASFVNDLINDPQRLAAHPWGEVLKEFDHWGMIGGALAPHRARYEELTAEKPTDVVYVCDNDWPGKNALQEISRIWGGKLKGIMFDNTFPPSWDMADDLPKSFWNGKRYIGPKLQALILPATHATDLVPSPTGKGRSVAVMRRQFREEWIHSITPETFLHVDWPNHLYSASEFNSRVAPFSDVDDTARLLRKDAVSKGMVLKYDPSRKPGIYGSTESGRYINTYSPSGIVFEKGDAKPFLEFMGKLVEDENDRHHLLKWCATLIARPDIRMLYGVLLISDAQGVGKGTLGEKILAPLIGELNVSYPNETEIVDSNFNYWLAHKRLAIVHEIYAGHSTKGYNRLKSIITDKYITVSKKYQANYEIENWIHVFACSNSMQALRLSLDDRRWFLPKITEEKQPPGYWQEFNRWLVFDNGLGIIGQWAVDYVAKHGPVTQGEAAPTSAMKQEVIEESMSPGMRLVSGFLAKIKEQVPDAMIADCDLIRLIQNEIYDGRHNDRLERPLTIRKLAKSLGWHIHPERFTGKDWGVIGINYRVICAAKKEAQTPSNLLRKAGKRPLNVVTAWAEFNQAEKNGTTIL